MEISTHNSKKAFTSGLNDLLDDMQASYDRGMVNSQIFEFQERIDSLALPYQDDQSLGRLRYKLYEAQAYLHFFRHNDEEALQFIDEAIIIRGATFDGAESLKDKILSHSVVPQYGDEVEPAQQIEGWLALFVVSLSIGAMFNLVKGTLELGTIKNITTNVMAAYPGLQNLIVVESLMQLIEAMIAIVTVVLVFKRKRIGKVLGISFLGGVLVWYLVDYLIATSMFANNSAAINEVNSAESSHGRIILFSVIWILYLIFSKRAKSTLIE